MAEARRLAWLYMESKLKESGDAKGNSSRAVDVLHPRLQWQIANLKRASSRRFSRIVRGNEEAIADDSSRSSRDPSL